MKYFEAENAFHESRRQVGRDSLVVSANRAAGRVIQNQVGAKSRLTRLLHLPRAAEFDHVFAKHAGAAVGRRAGRATPTASPAVSSRHFRLRTAGFVFVFVFVYPFVFVRC